MPASLHSAKIKNVLRHALPHVSSCGDPHSRMLACLASRPPLLALPAGASSGLFPATHPRKHPRPAGLTEWSPFAVAFFAGGFPRPRQVKRGVAGFSFREIPQNVGNTTHVSRVRLVSADQDLWPALATTTLATAIGFNVLALVIQFER
jgi:hypothetical protein